MFIRYIGFDLEYRNNCAIYVLVTKGHCSLQQIHKSSILCKCSVIALSQRVITAFKASYILYTELSTSRDNSIDCRTVGLDCSFFRTEVIMKPTYWARHHS